MMQVVKSIEEGLHVLNMYRVSLWTVPASFSARHPRTAVVFLCLAGLRASCCATAELRFNMSDSFWRASW